LKGLARLIVTKLPCEIQARITPPISDSFRLGRRAGRGCAVSADVLMMSGPCTVPALACIGICASAMVAVSFTSPALALATAARCRRRSRKVRSDRPG
jgi:hypothetical protein